MTTERLYTRRRVLQVTGGAAVAGIAGCVGSDPADDGAGAGGGGDGDDHDDGGGGEHHDEETTGHHDDGGGDGEHHEEETSGHGHDESVAEPTDAAEVRMLTEGGGFHFEPHVVRVTVGGTVSFVNDSGSHSATAYHPDNDQPLLAPEETDGWDSGVLSEAGATFDRTFETEGVYHYYCTPHETSGMLGSVVVGEPDPHEQPALEEPPAEKPDGVRQKLADLNETCRTALGDEH